MAKIKICGITRESETEVLNRMQVDYAGFVFFEKSKRNVSIEQAKEIKKHLKPSIKTVAVTVNPALDLIDEIIGIPTTHYRKCYSLIFIKITF